MCSNYTMLSGFWNNVKMCDFVRVTWHLHICDALDLCLLTSTIASRRTRCGIKKRPLKIVFTSSNFRRFCSHFFHLNFRCTTIATKLLVPRCEWSQFLQLIEFEMSKIFGNMFTHFKVKWRFCVYDFKQLEQFFILAFKLERWSSIWTDWSFPALTVIN